MADRQQTTQYTSAFETGRRYQVHPSYIWLQPIGYAFSFLIVLFAGGMQSISDIMELVSRGGTGGSPMGIAPMLLLGIGLLVAVYLLALLVHVLAYKRLNYVFDEKELSLYSGIVTKRRVHVPYARVQSVNHTATIIQRIVGVCTVKIETAGGSSNKGVRIPYVSLKDAEALRRDLFMRKAAALAGEHAHITYQAADATAAAAAAGAPTPPDAAMPVPPAAQDAVQRDRDTSDIGEWRGMFAGSAFEAEQESYRTGLTGKELLFSALSHSNNVGFVTMMGLVGLAPAFFSGPLVPVVIALFALLGYTIGVGSSMLAYGNFSLVRRASRIEVEHGLLQHTSSSIDIDRIQSVVIKQSFIRRLMGYCEISLGRIDSATGNEGKSSQGNTSAMTRGLTVHPFVKLDKVDGVLAQLLPEFADMPRRDELSHAPRVALRRALMRRCIWQNAALYIALCCAAFQAFLASAGLWERQSDAPIASPVLAICIAVYVLCALATAASALSAVLWFKGSGFSLNRRFASICNDGLTTELITVPRQKIQSGQTRTNPFQRLAKVASLKMVTAAGTRNTVTTLWDATREDAERWLDWMVPRV